MEGFSFFIPIVMVFVFVTMAISFCICVCRRRSMMHNQRPFYSPTYTTNTMSTTYPNQPGYPNTGIAHTAGYPQTTGYPSQLHVHQGMGTGYANYGAPPSYGDVVGSTHHDFSSSGFGHGSSGIGFDNMGSSCNTGGGADFGGSSNTCGGGGGFGGSSNTGGGGGTCGGDAF